MTAIKIAPVAKSHPARASVEQEFSSGCVWFTDAEGNEFKVGISTSGRLEIEAKASFAVSPRSRLRVELVSIDE